MSVNIFGSNSINTKNVDTKYIDNKFIILTTTRNTKVNKNGDVLNGPLDMLDNTITSSYIPTDPKDLVNKKYVDGLVTTPPSSAGDLTSKVNKAGDTLSGPLLMGTHKIGTSHVPVDDDDVINKKHLDEVIARRLNDDDLKMIMNNLSLKVNKAGDTLTGHLDMGFNKITSNHVLRVDSDLVNIKYLKSIYIKNNVGYIPELISNLLNASGFRVTDSGEAINYASWHAFTAWKYHWMPNSITNAWIQIECPKFVRIHRVALCGKIQGDRVDDKITNFSFSGRKYRPTFTSTNWVKLFTSSDELGDVVQFFDVDNSDSFKFFKLQINASVGTTRGLSLFQIYSLDSLKI